MDDFGGTALDLVGAMFHIVDDEVWLRRRGEPGPPLGESGDGAGHELAVRARAMTAEELQQLRGALATALLREVDGRLQRGDLVARSVEELP